jgi:type IV pilus assembly protein PilO
MGLSLDKLPWYGQVGIFAVLAACGGGAFYYYYEMPAHAAMQSRRGELTKIQADVARGLEASRKLPAFRQEVEQLEGRLTNLRAVLPEEKDAADLLRQLQTLATQSNLVITAFRPAPIITHELHAEWPINLELQGSYHNLGLFLDRLGKFTRIVNISGLTVKGRDKADPNATVTANCVATTFVLLDKPAPAKPGAAAHPADPGKKVA